MSEITGNQEKKKTEKNKKRIENPEGTITVKAALEMLKGKSDITKMGLRVAAVRDDFVFAYEENGKKKFLLDFAKFKKWIVQTIDAIPEGWKTIGISAKELGITTQYVHELIKKHKIKTNKIGAGRGKIYVDFEAIKIAYTAKKSKRNN